MREIRVGSVEIGIMKNKNEMEKKGCIILHSKALKMCVLKKKSYLGSLQISNRDLLCLTTI